MNKNGTKWDMDDMVTLYEQRAIGVPYKVIAEDLGRTEQSCWDKYRSTEWADTKIPDKIREAIKTRRIQNGIEQVKVSESRKIDNYKLRADIIADRLSEAVVPYEEAKLVNWTPQNRKPGHGSEDVGLILSDLHIGHDHSADETGGMSAYNMDIYQARLDNLKLAVADIYELHNQLYELPTLHIFCLGDIVDGMNDVGAWSPTYIMTPIMDQVMAGVESLSEAIRYWLTIFGEVKFYGIRGNHGRVAKSGVEKDYCNWDVIIYEFLRAKFENNPRITFDVPKCWWSLQEIRNHNFFLTHGDDVKSKGVPILGLLELERKMTASLRKPIDFMLAGHFHNASEFTTHNGRLLMNGSFVGADVYSLKNALPGTRAEQKIFGIHDTRGITWMYNINLDHERKRPKDDADTKVGN